MTDEQAKAYAAIADQLAKLEAAITTTEALPRSEEFTQAYVVIYPQSDDGVMYLKEDKNGPRAVKALINASWFTKDEAQRKAFDSLHINSGEGGTVNSARGELGRNLAAMKEAKATLLSVTLEAAD